jgi:hypothetical protein
LGVVASFARDRHLPRDQGAKRPGATRRGAGAEQTVSDVKGENPPPLVERWLQEQQQWQRTILGYLDSMVKNEEFLVHLGNAMRGSLLAGKPYPGAAPPAKDEPPAPADDRLDQVLFAIHQLQGQVQDLGMTLDEVRKELRALTGGAEPPARRRKTPTTKAAGKTRSSTSGAKGMS